MVHKFLNQCNIPWVHLIWESYYQNSLPPGENAQCSFWWKDCLKLLDTYKLHSSCTPGSGKSILFWKDNWAGNTLNSQWPQLASFALNPHMSLHQIINTEDTSSLFHLPFQWKPSNNIRRCLVCCKTSPFWIKMILGDSLPV